MLGKSPPSALRVSTRWCLLCHSLTDTEQSLVAVVGNNSFEGYTDHFLYPTDTKRITRWFRGGREAYASICSPECLSINHQTRSFTTSIGSADLTPFSPKIAALLRHIRDLSPELQLMIMSLTGPCPGLSAITVLLDTLPLLEMTHARPYSRQLSLYPEEVYVRRITIRGQSYISEISNQRHESMNKISCVSKPDRVILSLDDIGIRDICFEAQGSSSEPVQAPWYQHSDLSDANQTLFVTNNSFVVRQIASSSRVAVRYLWDCRTVPSISEHQWYARHRTIAGTESLFYMRHVDVDRKFAGLTLSCDMWTNMSFYAHHVNGDRLSSRAHMVEVERAYGNSLVWIYFPMSPGEKICGFWVLTLHGNLATVAIYTSLGRSRIFGPYHEPTGRANITVQSLNSSRSGYVNTIFYNDLRSEGTKRDLRLAISNTPNTTIEVPKLPRWPTSAVPDICKHTGQTWYHSQAPLKGIRSINICKNNTSQICFGIEICYEDHHKEVLGQWRFDQDVEILLNQDNAYAIHFHVGFINGIQCVQDIRFKPSSGLDRPQWVTMAMEGCLVWWFSRFGGVVVHEQNKMIGIGLDNR